MRTALFALTTGGIRLALHLYDALDSAGTLFFPERLRGHVPAECEAQYFRRLADAIRDAFGRYDTLVCVMATGIVVRMIAPYIDSKLYDPAVLVFDEQGRHGISLLSGHVGGANACTQKLCAAIGADPVITTATDVTGVRAPDAVAARLALRPVPKAAIQVLNTALLEGKHIDYFLDAALTQCDFYEAELRGAHISTVRFREELSPVEEGRYRVIITLPERVPAEVPDRTLYLTPRRLIAGVGCRAGVPEDDILRALNEACGQIGRNVSCIDLLASTEVKREEEGLLAAARTLGREIIFYTRGELAHMVERYGLKESDFVKRTIGVGNVSEAAALCAAGNNGGRMALGRTVLGKVTVALLWEK
ncbi:cobalt-precorrin 5A hydrolase [Selenomonas sp. F0473]|uniref:cobalt-precorrin 5A hydrolase n=1 Tax=Selenomonas sp. F0473 TaxID=999423 RepID=UPI00029E3BF9|nr:cobalt-precorrin 5A hydrolase [Selenomonas sp. F0473]EKU71754.1 hypothetical protein HMPREF9161_00439 [Selenomonas sp. F0473]